MSQVEEKLKMVAAVVYEPVIIKRLAFEIYLVFEKAGWPVPGSLTEHRK